MTKKRAATVDPEMAAIAEQHRISQQGGTEAFKRDWAARMERGLPELLPSQLHRHEESCWGAPHRIVYLGVGLNVRACKITQQVEEV